MALFIRLAVSGAALVLSAAAGAASPNMKPGLWEIKVRTEMAGVPMQMPAVTTRQCIRKQDMVPQTNSSGQDCEVTEQHTTGDTMTWRIECKSSDMQGSGNGKITYHGTTFQGKVEMSMQQQGQQMTMTQHMDGKRVGECQ